MPAVTETDYVAATSEGPVEGVISAQVVPVGVVTEVRVSDSCVTSAGPVRCGVGGFFVGVDVDAVVASGYYDVVAGSSAGSCPGGIQCCGGHCVAPAGPVAGCGGSAGSCRISESCVASCFCAADSDGVVCGRGAACPVVCAVG